jgi:hypothetical protein
MRSAAIIGYTGKGLFNTPTKIDNVKDLHTTFGKKSNLTAVAEQLIYSDFSPLVVRIEEDTETASCYLVDEDDTICMVISADSPGFVGSLTVVEIAKEDNNTFSILVTNSGEMTEFWGNLTPANAGETVNLASKWITVSVMTKAIPAVGRTELQLNNKKPSEIKLKAILDAVKSVEDVDIEFISLPDCDSPEIINVVLQYLEEDRPDVMLVIDPPWECDLLQTYKWCKELIPSEQGVIFWPWLNHERKSIPPSGPVLVALLNWPFIWKPVRTKLAGVSSAAFNIHHDELAYLSKQEHFINIATKKNDSLVLETRVLTLAGSKLSDRRLFNYIKSKISKVGKELLRSYDPVSNKFRHNFIECTDYILKPIKDDQGLNNYVVQVNEFCKPQEFEIDLELSIKDSVEIVNICFKFAK